MRTTNGTARALFLRQDQRYLKTADERIEKFKALGFIAWAETVRQKRACICMAQMLGTHWHGNSELQAQVPPMKQEPV